MRVSTENGKVAFLGGNRSDVRGNLGRGPTMPNNRTGAPFPFIFEDTEKYQVTRLSERATSNPGTGCFRCGEGIRVICLILCRVLCELNLLAKAGTH